MNRTFLLKPEISSVKLFCRLILLESFILILQLVLTRGHCCSCNTRNAERISDKVALNQRYPVPKNLLSYHLKIIDGKNMILF